MTRALQDAGISVDDIDYINAHATSTRQGDMYEAIALNRMFNEKRALISSTKSMTGHECWMAGASEIVYSLIGPGSMFGNNLLYADDKRYKGNVIAKKKTTLYLIHKNNLMKLLANNPKFLEFFLSTASNKVKDLNARVRLLSFQILEERLMFLLHENNGSLSYQSITSLASELGAERETLSRLISRLSKEGTIKKEKHLLVAL
jgi:CRP-like cAMP-binding protein